MSSKFSLLANALPTFSRETTVEAKVDQLADYQVQLLDYLRYTLHNLDSENFNETGLTEIMNPVVVEIKNTKGAVTSLTIKADGLSSTVEALGSDLGEFESWTKGQVSSLSSRIKQTAGEISAVVSAVSDTGGNVTAASIVAAINKAGSSVKISADHVELIGDYVTISDLSGYGTVKIHAGNIAAGGTISAVDFVAKGSMDGSNYNSFIVKNDDDIEIGGIGYGYVSEDTQHEDKLYLRTEAYWSYADYRYHYPDIKLLSGGNISLEAPNGDVIWIRSGFSVSLSGSMVQIFDEGSNAVWQFRDGGLYKNDEKVL